jgi:TolB-like protein/Flp pilus assembly protein TadD
VSATLRFGEFELDLAAYALRRRGTPIHLERRPMELLILLAERPAELVARQSLIERLWPKGVFIDFDTGLNTAIRKIRHALDDPSSNPRIIETVAGKGYRFIAPVEAVRSTIARVRVAVLPFVLLPADPELDHLADGLTEETIASLGQINPNRLHVIGRATTMTYRGNQKAVAEIGKDLGVEFVVEGLLQAVGDELRIHAAITRTSDQARIWSGTYDRNRAALLRVQQQLSATIAEQVSVRAHSARASTLASRHSPDPRATDLYLRGRRLWNQLTPQTTLMALQCFAQATEIDPAYALAWAAIGEANASSPINGDVNPADAAVAARHAVTRAMQSNPELGEVLHAAAQLEWMLEWKWSEAEQRLRRAVALDSSFVWSQTILAHLLSQMGRHDEARATMDDALALDPRAALSFAMSSQIAFQARSFDLARRHAEHAIELGPMFWVGYMMLGQALERAGEPQSALDSLEMAIRLSGGNSKPVGLRGFILAGQGRIDEALGVVQGLEATARDRYIPPYANALIYAGLNDTAAAFEWLDRAVLARDVHAIFLTADPKWDALRGDPRFAQLLERCGFASARA